MGILLDLLKAVIPLGKFKDALLKEANPLLQKLQFLHEQSQKISSFNFHNALTNVLKKSTNLETQAYNQFLNKINIPKLLENQIGKTIKPFSQIANYVKQNLQQQKINKEIVPESNVMLNLSSSALRSGMFIPTITVLKTENDKLVNQRGVTRLWFKKGHHYDYYTISYNIWVKMYNAVGKNGDGAWSVYLEDVLHHSAGQRVKLTQAQIKRGYKSISSPKDTKTRKFIINKNIPKIKGVKTVKKMSTLQKIVSKAK